MQHIATPKIATVVLMDQDFFLCGFITTKIIYFTINVLLTITQMFVRRTSMGEVEGNMTDGRAVDMSLTCTGAPTPSMMGGPSITIDSSILEHRLVPGADYRVWLFPRAQEVVEEFLRHVSNEAPISHVQGGEQLDHLGRAFG